MSGLPIVPPGEGLPLPTPRPSTIPGLLPPEGMMVPRPWWLLPDNIRELLEQAGTRGAAKAPELTNRDRDILRTCALAVRRARRMTNGGDPEKALAGRRQLLSVAQYVLGFCDAKGLSVGLSGLGLIAAKQPDSVELDPALDALEAELLAMSELTRTGLLLGVGVALVAAGVVCKIAGSMMQE